MCAPAHGILLCQAIARPPAVIWPAFGLPCIVCCIKLSTLTSTGIGWMTSLVQLDALFLSAFHLFHTRQAAYKFPNPVMLGAAACDIFAATSPWPLLALLLNCGVRALCSKNVHIRTSANVAVGLKCFWLWCSVLNGETLQSLCALVLANDHCADTTV